jgi:hypothetical protein
VEGPTIYEAVIFAEVVNASADGLVATAPGQHSVSICYKRVEKLSLG